jgi:hypothetical protein
MKYHFPTFNQEVSKDKPSMKIDTKSVIETIRTRLNTLTKTLKSKKFIDRIGKIK